MSTALLLSAEQRSRIAISAAALVSQPAFAARIEREVEAVFEENPTLPRTELIRCVVCALSFPKLSQAVGTSPAAASPQATTQTKTAA
ncbi:MAG: hypothetical protein ABMA13_16080 [Chthoniobacteraceae bacterium]